MDRLDMALDDLIKHKPRRPKNTGAGKRKEGAPTVAKAAGGSIKKKGQKPSGGGVKLVQPTGASHVVVQPGRAEGRARQQDRQPRAAGNGSILSRIGQPGAGVSGTAISFENLNFDIMKDDIAELCGTVGEVKNAEIIFDRSGRSTGAATATFARRSDALTAVKKFNGLALDGTKMIVKLAGANGKENPFNPSGEGRRKGSADGKAAMFGTAMDDDEPHFKVNLGGGSKASGVCFAFQRGECTRGDDCRFSHELSGAAPQRPTRPDRGNDRNKGGRGANDRKGGRGGQGAGGRGARRGNQQPVSASALDDELDGYFAQR